MWALFQRFFLQPADLQQNLLKKRSSVPENADEETLIDIATEAFVRELGLGDSSVLKGKVMIREVAAGTYLMKEESNKVTKANDAYVHETDFCVRT